MNVGVYEAKSRLSELLQQVRSGKEVVITSHGKPIARLVPAGEPVTPDRAAAARKIRALRKRLNIRTRVSTRTLVDEAVIDGLCRGQLGRPGLVRGQPSHRIQREDAATRRGRRRTRIVWHLEFANALYQLERRHKLKPDDTNAILNHVQDLALEVDTSPPEQARLLDLARRYGLSVYDASYLELALRSSLELAASDGPLSAAAAKAGLRAQ